MPTHHAICGRGCRWTTEIAIISSLACDEDTDPCVNIDFISLAFFGCLKFIYQGPFDEIQWIFQPDMGITELEGNSGNIYFHV